MPENELHARLNLFSQILGSINIELRYYLYGMRENYIICSEANRKDLKKYRYIMECIRCSSRDDAISLTRSSITSMFPFVNDSVWSRGFLTVPPLLKYLLRFTCCRDHT